MTASVVLTLLKAWWRGSLIVLLVLCLWGTWSCKGAASDRAARKLATERLARQAAEETARSCDAALTVQTAAVTAHEKRMVADRAEMRRAEEASAERQRRDHLALQERDVREEQLRQALAVLPVEDRCEEAARWAAARYREVTHAR